MRHIRDISSHCQHSSRKWTLKHQLYFKGLVWLRSTDVKCGVYENSQLLIRSHNQHLKKTFPKHTSHPRHNNKTQHRVCKCIWNYLKSVRQISVSVSTQLYPENYTTELSMKVIFQSQNITKKQFCNLMHFPGVKNSLIGSVQLLDKLST